MAADTKCAPTVFFVPGMWHGPWGFDKVRGILSARNLESEASSLATVGAVDASIGLNDDVAKIRSALTSLIDEGKEVVIVAHSYGGLVTSNAVKDLGIKQRTAQGLSGGVAMVLFLASFAIHAGENIVEYLGLLPWWDISDDGFMTPITPLDFFYGDVETTLANTAVAALKPAPLQVIKDRSSYDLRDGSFELGYLFCEDDLAFSIEDQEAMFSEFPAGSFSARFKSSHSPFFSMPDKLAESIEDAINHVLAKRLSK
ncbi:hypothetical protein GGR51DRAFT_507431 [Nemania sp. FL0031]|nr:hypothetical protein GGR51DRAFT_507431 [Nemania sp. FL0031]